MPNGGGTAADYAHDAASRAQRTAQDAIRADADTREALRRLIGVLIAKGVLTDREAAYVWKGET